METYIVSKGALKDGSGYIILTDFLYWMHYENDLKDWCTSHLAKGELAFKGAVIEFTSEDELVLFTLRWS